MEEDNKTRLQERYVELQLLDEQMKEVQKHLQHFDQQIQDVIAVRQSLDELRNVREGEESLVPIANGIFARAKLTNLRELLVNVGSNIVVAKSIDEAKKLLEQQSSEIQAIRTRIAAQLEKLATRAQALQEELMKLIETK